MQIAMPFGSGMAGNIGFNFPSDNQATQVPQNIQVFPQAPQNFYGAQTSLGYQTSPSFKNPTNYQPSIQNAYQNSGYPAAQMQLPYQQTPLANNIYPVAQNPYQSHTANYPNYSPGQINPQSYQNTPYANQNSFQHSSSMGSIDYQNLNNSYQRTYPQTNPPRSMFGSNQKKEVV